MQITINHPASSFGVPVILDDSGLPLDYADGFRRCRYRLNMSTVEIGKHLGASGRTVEGYEQGTGKVGARQRAPVACNLSVKLFRVAGYADSPRENRQCADGGSAFFAGGGFVVGCFHSV